MEKIFYISLFFTVFFTFGQQLSHDEKCSTSHSGDKQCQGLLANTLCTDKDKKLKICTVSERTLGRNTCKCVPPSPLKTIFLNDNIFYSCGNNSTSCSSHNIGDLCTLENQSVGVCAIANKFASMNECLCIPIPSPLKVQVAKKKEVCSSHQSSTSCYSREIGEECSEKNKQGYCVKDGSLSSITSCHCRPYLE